jgi:hypothetical protein
MAYEYRHLDPNEIKRIRTVMAEAGCASHTSDLYQDEVLQILDADGTQESGAVIEVGCYLGGLTVQLAYACLKLGRRLHVVDINCQYMGTALHHITSLGLSKNVAAFLGDLQSYLSGVSFPRPLSAVVIDGDHRYDAVLADIKALVHGTSRPKHVVFHDFSLRYSTPELQDVRVDKAVRDGFGPHAELIPIGSVAGQDSVLRTVPEADGHFHEIGQPEGIHVRVGALKK